MSIDTDKPRNLGGCPTLEKQAENAHNKAEIRVDLEMGKLSLKAIKHLAKMMNKIDSFKENTQLTIIDKILRSNKDYMNAKRALLAEKETPLEEEDYDIQISLSSSEDENTTLN